MLYGADYFTEDEWKKVDGLLHKGKYVFTQGPPRNVLEEELMSFDESKDSKANINVRTESFDTFELIEDDPMQAFAEQTTSPATVSTESPSETPNTTSAGVSSDEETAPMQKLKEATAMGDLFEMAAAPASKEEFAQPSPNGGLPLGCTQAQLDKVKAFNAGLTKAGKKSKSKSKMLPRAQKYTA